MSNGEVIGNIEYTSGNYDNEGNLIDKFLPTFTTEFCEVGIYGEIVYFTFVIYSNSYNDSLIKDLNNFLNFSIYGFADFKDNFVLDESLAKRIIKEKYFQINFDYDINDNNNFLFEEYLKIKKILLDNGLNIVNQLKINLVCV